MSGHLQVTHVSGDRFSIDVRGHTLTTDQPVADGGEDTAPTPTEFFIAGLASCIAFYGQRYCARHGIDPTGLHVACDYSIGGKPVRVEEITVRLTPPDALPADRRAGFLAIASHCTIHNTLLDPPAVQIALAEPVRP